MHNEYLAVVDDHDQIIKHLPRSEIHTRGLLHRAVHIMVFNDQGSLFLQKRSMQKDSNPGLWDSSAAGHVDAGEEYDCCAHRELWEELGVKADLRSLFKLEPNLELGMEFIKVYSCLHNGPFVLSSEEIDEGAWLSADEVFKRVTQDDSSLTLTFKTIWRQFQVFIPR